MTNSLQKWIDDNKLVVSESKINDSDTIIIDTFGRFLYLHPFDDKIIDDDFSFILSDDEFDILDSKKVDYILFEFGTKFYYSSLKQDKNKYNEIVYKPEFNDFKYIGKTSEPFLMDFVHLGVHDEYEMLNGSGGCEVWVKKAKFLGHKFLGVCDKNTLASSLSFQTYCEKMGLKSIIGETISVAINYNEDDNIPETFELKLFVLNNVGWHNLLLINKCINVDYNGFIPDEQLYKLGEGICCVVPENSEFNYLLDDRKKVISLIETYKNSFDDLYYQIDTVEYVSEQLFKKHLKNIDDYICKYKNKIKPILINDSYYLDEEEHDLKSLLNSVSGKVSAESGNQFFKTVGDTIHSYEEWLDDTQPLLDVIIEGIENTNILANEVKFRIDNSERKIPPFEVENPEDLFFDLLDKGIKNKLVGKVNNIDNYMKRIEIECNLIVPNDLCSYFLILWDICNWCKTQDIMVGPGRGSVCGSLVAYCLDITQIDPLKYNLYFERFLNESRVSAHHAYHLTLENGREITFRDGDNIPLMDGTNIEANKNIDFTKIDIDVSKIIK